MTSDSPQRGGLPATRRAQQQQYCSVESLKETSDTAMTSSYRMLRLITSSASIVPRFIIFYKTYARLDLSL